MNRFNEVAVKRNPQLTCSIQYSKMVINTAKDAKAQIPSTQIQSSIVAGTLSLKIFIIISFPVHRISGNVPTYRYLPEDNDSANSEDCWFMDLQLNQVHELVSICLVANLNEITLILERQCKILTFF
jgi:hypothetical protein